MLQYFLTQGADRSFITPELRHMLSYKSIKQEETYGVEATNEPLDNIYEILINCVLTHNKYTFHDYLVPMTIGSVDVIIVMK